MRPLYLLFDGLLLCFDVISLFNAARPNFNSRSNNMGGRCLHIQDLRIYKFPCTDGDPLADKSFLSLFSPCVYCK